MTNRSLQSSTMLPTLMVDWMVGQSHCSLFQQHHHHIIIIIIILPKQSWSTTPVSFVFHPNMISQQPATPTMKSWMSTLLLLPLLQLPDNGNLMSAQLSRWTYYISNIFHGVHSVSMPWHRKGCGRRNGEDPKEQPIPARRSRRFKTEKYDRSNDHKLEKMSCGCSAIILCDLVYGDENISLKDGIACYEGTMSASHSNSILQQ